MPYEPTKVEMYKQALSGIGVRVDMYHAEAMYELAKMVLSNKDGGDLEKMCAIRAAAKENNPYVMQWSNYSHRENHQI